MNSHLAHDLAAGGQDDLIAVGHRQLHRPLLGSKHLHHLTHLSLQRDFPAEGDCEVIAGPERYVKLDHSAPSRKIRSTGTVNT